MGEKGDGSGGQGGGKWGERGRELGMGYPLSTPSLYLNLTSYSRADTVFGKIFVSVGDIV